MADPITKGHTRPWRETAVVRRLPLWPGDTGDFGEDRAGYLPPGLCQPVST